MRVFAYTLLSITPILSWLHVTESQYACRYNTAYYCVSPKICYSLERVNAANWKNAIDICKQRGGNLPALNLKAEDDAIKTLVEMKASDIYGNEFLWLRGFYNSNNILKKIQIFENELLGICNCPAFKRTAENKWYKVMIACNKTVGIVICEMPCIETRQNAGDDMSTTPTESPSTTGTTTQQQLDETTEAKTILEIRTTILPETTTVPRTSTIITTTAPKTTTVPRTSTVITTTAPKTTTVPRTSTVITTTAPRTTTVPRTSTVITTTAPKTTTLPRTSTVITTTAPKTTTVSITSTVITITAPKTTTVPRPSTVITATLPKTTTFPATSTFITTTVPVTSTVISTTAPKTTTIKKTKASVTSAVITKTEPKTTTIPVSSTFITTKLPITSTVISTTMPKTTTVPIASTVTITPVPKTTTVPRNSTFITTTVPETTMIPMTATISRTTRPKTDMPIESTFITRVFSETKPTLATTLQKTSIFTATALQETTPKLTISTFVKQISNFSSIALNSATTTMPWPTTSGTDFGAVTVSSTEFSTLVTSSTTPSGCFYDGVSYEVGDIISDYENNSCTRLVCYANGVQQEIHSSCCTYQSDVYASQRLIFMTQCYQLICNNGRLVSAPYCGSDFVQVEYGDYITCYHVSSSVMTRLSAQMYCLNLGGILAEPTTPQMFSQLRLFFLDKVVGKGHVAGWLGAVRYSNEYYWQTKKPRLPLSGLQQVTTCQGNGFINYSSAVQIHYTGNSKSKEFCWKEVPKETMAVAICSKC